MILENFSTRLETTKIYMPDQLKEVLKIVRPNFRFSYSNTKQKYFNVPMALDLETSSFYEDGKKVGLMYAWTIGIYGLVIIGRTWQELTSFLEELADILKLDVNKRVLIYVHNLQFDFQFFRSHFTFEQVFAIDRRQPLYALTDRGIEFRCSYILSGLSLAKVGENLLRYHCNKMVGDLNYNLIRHSGTRLTKKELGYIAADARVVMAYIAEEIENNEGISKIPYTKTGYVRRYVRDCCLFVPGLPHKHPKSQHKRLRYKDLMLNLTMDEQLYRLNKNAFAGGFTHANSIYVGKILENVSSDDLTSSYPTEMIANRFPMGAPEWVDTSKLNKDSFYQLLDDYCCMFTITFTNIREKPDVFENPISRSKCIHIDGWTETDENGNEDYFKPIINNGRVVQAGELEISITEVDFEVFGWFYEWDYFTISEMVTWARGWLPKDFVLAILELYKNKTELKGVKGKEEEYQVSKGMINGCYGMCVTDPVREINDYTDQWEEPYMPDISEKMKKYNSQAARFLYYPWGVYVTAYARRSLFTAIYEAGEDYVYSDTDSIKMKNREKHAAFFKQYNEDVIKKLEYALECQGIDTSYIRPKTKEGIEKPLGVWDFEGVYTMKTLGAKRYLTEKNGELELTVSGINKKIAVPYLLKKYKNNKAVFEAFREGLDIPAGYSGKSTHTYIDTPRNGVVKDYQGNTLEYTELTGIHLEETGYHLSIASEFNQFLLMRLKGI